MKSYAIKGRRALGCLIVIAAFLSGMAHAQCAEELRKLAPEALKGSAKPRPIQLKQVAPDLYFLLE